MPEAQFRTQGGSRQVWTSPYSSNDWESYGDGTTNYVEFGTDTVNAAFFDHFQQKSYAFIGTKMYELDTTNVNVDSVQDYGT